MKKYIYPNNKLIKRFDFDSYLWLFIHLLTFDCLLAHKPARIGHQWDDADERNANEMLHPNKKNYTVYDITYRILSIDHTHSAHTHARREKENDHYDKKYVNFLVETFFITTFQSNLVNFRYESFNVYTHHLNVRESLSLYPFLCHILFLR